MPTTIRPAIAADLPIITEIYNEAGVGSTASYDLEPVSIQNRREWLAAHERAEFPVLVGEVDGSVVGFAAYSRYNPKPGYDHTVEHSVYVHADHRASGIGRLLMAALIDVARGQGRHVMLGLLDADNHASIAFHQRLGFVPVAHLPQVGRKFDRWLDVVIVALMLDAERSIRPEPASSPQ